MDSVPSDYHVHSVEADGLSLWRSRRLPPPGGVLGPPTGPTVRQFEGAWTKGDFPSLIAQRAVAADVDARYLALAGRRAVGTLRQATGPSPPASPDTHALLTSLGVWTGGDGRTPWDSEDRSVGVQAIVGRLASKRILVTRDDAFRVCPTCGTPRSPERIVYDEQEGDTFLVRFAVPLGERTVSALVWVDVPWKLLGTSALLVNPEVRYVIADYRRRDEHEVILTSAPSLQRLRSWIPDATLEVLDERPGKELQGTPYVYPLRHEFPTGGDLTAPAGTILASTAVSESGTGIVPLVPGHGPTDAKIAAGFGVAGWPLVTPRGKLDFTLMHKYVGLDLETANEFVLRDLSEAGALLARLRVKRGVPYCALCGTPLLWTPGRAWCLEPSHLPADRRATFSRLFPKESLPAETEVAPWPVSEAVESNGAGTVALFECARCDRLEAPNGPEACPCGGQRRLVRRQLLPSSEAAFAAWARFDPFPDTDSVHLYVGYRRRLPAVVNHLAALCGVEGYVGDISLTVVPTVAAVDAPELVTTFGADAVRAAFVRGRSQDSPGGRFGDRCRQEADRIERWYLLARDVGAKCDPSMLATFSRPIGGFLGELEVEDRAILARWERTRTLAVAHYDQCAPALAYRRACRFLDNDLVDYRELVEPRLALSGTPTTKRGALRTLAHLTRSLSEVLAPILPFTAEAVHRLLSVERTSLFDQPMSGLDPTLRNDELVAAWERWSTVLRSVDRFRRSVGVSRATPLPLLVLVAPADDVGDHLRAEKETLARLARVQRLEIASPREPWSGRQRTARPVESEIQKAYPTQSSQIIHVLHRMPPRRWESALRQEELTVVINGLPRRVFPNMVAFSDTLPDRMVPAPWSLGEMYLELPAGATLAKRAMPPLSTDAFWLVRRLERRLRADSPTANAATRIALVTAKDPLAAELRSAGEALGAYLGLRELRVVSQSEEPTPPNALTGRGRTGEPWSVYVPNLSARRTRTKRPRTGARLSRISVSTLEAVPEADYADDKFLAHEEEVRGLGRELDDIIGIPLLGPSKVSLAWDLGFHTVEEFRKAPYETVSAIPGFGGPVASVVLTKLGVTLPPIMAGWPRPPAVIADAPPRPTLVPEPVVGFKTAAPALGPPSIDPDLASRMSAASPHRVEPPPSAPPMEDAEQNELRPAPLAARESLPPVGSQSELANPEVGEPPAQPLADASEDEPTPPTPLLATAVPVAELTVPVEMDVATDDASSETTSPSHPEPAGPIAEGEAPESTPGPRSTAPEEASFPVEFPATGSEPPEPETPVALEPTPEAVRTEPPPPTTLPAEAPPESKVESDRIVEEESAPPETSAPAPPEVPVSPPEPVGPSEILTVAPPPGIAFESAPLEESARAQEVEGAPPPEAKSLAAESEKSSPADATPPVATETIEPGPNAEPGVAPDEVGEAPTEPVQLPPSPEHRPQEVQSEATPGAPAEVVPPGEPAPGISDPSSPEPPASSPSTGGTAAGLPPSEEPSPPKIDLERESGIAPIPGGTRPEVPPDRAAPAPRSPTDFSSPVAPLDLSTSSLTPLTEVSEPPAPPSGIELSSGESLVASLSGILEAAAAGHRGVCVVRESPERIRARVGSRPIEVFWLTNIGRGPALRPSDLEGAWTFLSRKLLEERVTAFFLEGIEYLVRLHGPDAVLNGLVQFDRLARENDARVWLYLAPALMKPEDLERFQSTFGGASPSS